MSTQTNAEWAAIEVMEWASKDPYLAWWDQGGTCVREAFSWNPAVSADDDILVRDKLPEVLTPEEMKLWRCEVVLRAIRWVAVSPDHASELICYYQPGDYTAAARAVWDNRKDGEK